MLLLHLLSRYNNNRTVCNNRLQLKAIQDAMQTINHFYSGTQICFLQWWLSCCVCCLHLTNTQLYKLWHKLIFQCITPAKGGARGSNVMTTGPPNPWQHPWHQHLGWAPVSWHQDVSAQNCCMIHVRHVFIYTCSECVMRACCGQHLISTSAVQHVHRDGF